MKKLFVVLLTAFVLFSASSAFAIELEGKNSVNVQFQLISPDEGDDIAIFYGGYSKFLSSNVSVGGQIALVDYGSGEMTMLNLEGKYHFAMSETAVPYVGASLGQADDGDDSYGMYGVKLGLDQFLTESTAINYEYRIDSIDYDGGSSETGSFLIGLKYIF